MNREGLALLRAVVERNSALQEAIKKGDCAVIAADVNGWMPPDMQITAIDVFHALKGRPGFPLPRHNAEMLRARIDDVAVLHSARINSALKGEPGIAAIQTIVNELNLSPDPSEQVSVEDVAAAMDWKPVPVPSHTVQATAALVGVGAVK